MKQAIAMMIVFLHAIFGVQSVLAQQTTTKESSATLESTNAQENSLSNYLEKDDEPTLEEATMLVGQTSALVQVGSARSDKRLGFVNFRRIMSSIPQLSGVREALAQEFSAQKSSLEQANAELKVLEKQVGANNKELDYETLAQQLIAKRREIARQEATFRDNYSVRRNEEIAKLQKQVLDEIITLAKEQGYDVILNDNGVLYVSEEADLTQVVISRLLDKTPSVGESE